MKIKRDWAVLLEFCILMGSSNYIGSLANIIQSPTNQTTCYGTIATFTCVTSPTLITWKINGMNPLTLGITYPATQTISQGSQSESNLTFQSIPSLYGASVVCGDGQNYSLPAFLTIIGSSSLPILSVIPCNSTCVNISWIFSSDSTSVLNYNVQIMSKLGAMVYTQTLNGTQLTYNIPDPCDHYDAVVTAIYSHSNVICLQNGSIQLGGAYPLIPFISSNMIIECSLVSQDMLNVNISVPFQQGVCSYQFYWTLSSQMSSYTNQKPIMSYQNQSILNITVPINQQIHLTIVALNSYGNNSYTMDLNTYEIVVIMINTTSLPGPWTAECIFISCSTSIGCLVYLNDTYCTAFKRDTTSSTDVSCPVRSSSLLPGPGLYAVKAYTVYSSGSISYYPVYNGTTELKNRANTPPPAETTKNDIIVGVVVPTCIIIILAVVMAGLVWAVKRRAKRNTLQFDNSKRNIQNNLLGISYIELQSNDDPIKNHLKQLIEEGNNSEFLRLLTDDYMKSRYDDGNTLLHLAVINTNPGIVDLLQQKEFDMNITDNNGTTALHLAARFGNTICLQKLLSLEHVVRDKVDKVNNLALHEAAMNNQLACLRVFRSYRFDFTHQGKNGCTVLHCAATNGWLEGVKFALEDRNVNVDAKDNDMRTSLHEAAEYGHIECVKYLIEKGADVNSVSVDNITALHEAAKYGRTNCVQYLISKGADVKLIASDGYTPLHRAVLSEQVDVIKLLLEEPGGEVNCCNTPKSTPLGIAAMNGSVMILNLLLAKLTDKSAVNGQDYLGNTALHYAAAAGHCEVISSLLKHPCIQPNIKNNDGKTAMDLANQENRSNVVKILSTYKTQVTEERGNNPVDTTPAAECTNAPQDRTIQVTEERGNDPVDTTSAAERTSVPQDRRTQNLHEATRKGDTEQLKVIIETYNINEKDKDGKTPLHIAAEHGFISCLSILIKTHGIEVNRQDKAGSTPLHLAARSGIASCVQILLSHEGIEKDGKDNVGNPALFEAALHCRLPCFKVFKLNGFNFEQKGKDRNTVLHCAAKIGWQAGVEYILEIPNAASLLNCTNMKEHIPLHLAAKYGHESCVDLLVDKGSDVNAQSKTGNTSLHRAVINGHGKVIQSLLKNEKIEVDKANNNLNTPLNDAAVNGHADIATWLLKKGADVMSANKNGNTPLHHAAAGGHIEIMTVLLSSKGIDCNALNKAGKTALELAQEGKHNNAVTILKSHMEMVQKGTISL